VKHIACIRITYAAIEDLLLPEGSRVLEIWQDFADKYTQTFRIVVEHPDLPDVAEGQIPMTADIVMTADMVKKFSI